MRREIVISGSHVFLDIMDILSSLNGTLLSFTFGYPLTLQQRRGLFQNKVIWEGFDNEIPVYL